MLSALPDTNIYYKGKRQFVRPRIYERLICMTQWLYELHRLGSRADFVPCDPYGAVTKRYRIFEAIQSFSTQGNSGNKQIVRLN